MTTSTRSEKVEAPPAKRHLEGDMYIRLAIYYNVYLLHVVLSLYIQAVGYKKAKFFVVSEKIRNNSNETNMILDHNIFIS